MLHFVAGSPAALAALVFCFVLVCVFEFANGFHDTANAVATVIYTHSLKPTTAVLLSGAMNFLGVLLGGIAVAYALVELLPPDVLSPPNGDPAVPMLVSLFATALAWNLATWWFGIPNSSSHCVIGSLIGVAVGDALVHARGVAASIDWSQILKVLRALAISPVLGFAGAALLYLAMRAVIRDPALYQPPTEGKKTAGWVRGLLILTCSSVSFSHGTNDGQKSIGLIMLTIIGLAPATFALNPAADAQIRGLGGYAQQAAPLIARFASNHTDALDAAKRLTQAGPALGAQGGALGAGEDTQALRADPGAGQQAALAATRSGLRNDSYELVGALQAVAKNPAANPMQKAQAVGLRGNIRRAVEYAPWWVRVLSATCLGLGTMIGYKRIVHTLGERLGNAHLTPAQGASAELVGAALIATAGFTGLPVSTTHIITSGIAGTMVGSGAGINRSMLARIALAWVFTLPITMAAAAGIFYALTS